MTDAVVFFACAGGDFRSGVNCLLVTVTGTVAWGMSGSPSGFYHSFVLEHSAPEPNSGKQTHHIVSASLRTRMLEDSNDVGASAGNKKKRR